MRETLNRMLAGLRDYWAKQSRKNRIRIGIMGGAVIILSIVVVALLTRTKWVVLPNTGDQTTMASIQATLGGNGIRYRTNEDGLLEVPEQSFDQAQVVLFENALVGTPVFGDDIMANAGSFGTSTQHARELYDMQLGEWIRTMLMQNPRVQNAFAIVNQGETSPFRIQTNTRKPTASIQLTLVDSEPLSQTEVRAIADVVKGAIQGIEYEDIYITDNFYNTYSPSDDLQNLREEYDQRIAFQSRLADLAKQQATQLLAPIYGTDNLRIQAYVRLNFDSTVINKVEFDPPIPGNEEGMIRSSEEIYERQRNWAYAAGIPGTDTNELGTGGTPEYPWGNLDENDWYYRSVVNLNYDLNETRTAIERARGNIEEFGIAVAINSNYLGLDQQTEEELDVEIPRYTAEVTDMLAKGIGIGAGNISVQHIPFSAADDLFAQMQAAQEAREARERQERLIDMILMYSTILALAVMVILLVRYIVKTLRPPPEPEVILTAEGPIASIDLLADEEEEEVVEIMEDSRPQLEEIELNVQKSAALEQIEKFIDKDPASVAQLLRNWLSEE